MYLLDTNVVSELRKMRPHGGVLAWIEPIPETELFLSAVTVGEIQAGIEITRTQDASKARELESWLDRLGSNLNILPMDAATFRLWAKLMHKKSDAVYEDAMIAACALIHRLTVITRNVRDFEPFNVPIINPFETPPSG
jgi:toxin FitB